MWRNHFRRVISLGGGIAVAGLSLMIGAAAPARAQDYAAVLAQPDRSDADRKNDTRRDALGLLTFAGPKTGWKVLDMGADAGYSTELMARSVGPTGKVWAQNDKTFDALEARLKTPAMGNSVSLIRKYDEPFPADVKDADLITFFFAYHDTTYMEVDRAKMDKAMFDVLKPGGVLVVADYAALPEDGATVGKKYHRIAEQSLRSELEAAGFKFVASADFLRNPDDPRTAVVFRSPIKVDSFVLKFQKPQ